MATAAQLEQQLASQQSDYLGRLEGAGQLPKVVSEEWNKAGGAETTRLRGQEADLLKNYVSSGAAAREKYKEVWDPFARDRLAANQRQLEYSPVADIRSELAMRAEALGVATNSAQSMYGADLEKRKTGLGFTEAAYSRAYQREEDSRQRASAAASRSAAAKKEKELTQSDINGAVDVLWSIPSDNPSDKRYDKEGNVIGSNDRVLSQSEAKEGLRRLIGLYGDPNRAYDVFKRAFSAGGFSKYGKYDL